MNCINRWYLVRWYLVALSSIATAGMVQATVFLESANQPRVNLTQPCIGYLELSSTIISSKDFKQRLAALIKNPLVVGIIMVVDSGGGAAHVGWDIYDALVKANNKKPIVTYTEDICASAAYLAACATSKIVANCGAIVGSIGIVRTIEKVEPTGFKQNGLKGKIAFHRFKKGKFKQMGNPYDPMTEDDLQQLEDETNAGYQKFCETVALHRNLPVEAVTAQESLTFVGQKAYEQGLVDVVGDFDVALNLLAHEMTTRGVTATPLTAELLKESILMPPAEIMPAYEETDSRYEELVWPSLGRSLLWL